jgi:acetyltransferase-like isoleucine patch superfamily enzyme
VIGNGVWLGARAMVLPGVTIGKSSVIGAGVVVSEDVPENTLLTGATKLSIARWR